MTTQPQSNPEFPARPSPAQNPASLDHVVTSEDVLRQLSAIGISPSAHSPFAHIPLRPAAESPSSAPDVTIPIEALRTFAAPDCSLRIRYLVPDNAIDSFFYSTADGIWGAWQEQSGVRVSGPWELADIIVHIGVLIVPDGCLPSTLNISLSNRGLTALIASIDIIRQQILQSICERRPRQPTGITFPAAVEQVNAAKAMADRRWVLRLLNEFLPASGVLTPDELQHGFGELCQQELLTKVGADTSLSISDTLMGISSALISPLPAVAIGAPASPDTALANSILLMRGQSLYGIEHQPVAQSAPNRLFGFDAQSFERQMAEVLSRLLTPVPSGAPQQQHEEARPQARPQARPATGPSAHASPAAMPVARDLTTCPGCGRQVETHRFCSQCGHAL